MMAKFAHWRFKHFALIFFGGFALLVAGANIAAADGPISLNIGGGGVSGNILGFNFGNSGGSAATSASFSGVRSISQVCSFTLSKTELKVVQKAVGCFERMFLGVVENKVKGMVDTLRDAVMAALSLAVIFFGIKASTGITNEQKIKPEFFILAIKIAFIGWLLFNYGILEMWNLTQSAYKGLIEMVFVVPQMTSCQIGSASLDSVWKSTDCLIASFIGWNAPNATGTTFNGVPLLFGMFTSALNSGAGGAIIALIVIMTIFQMIMSLIRVAFVYIFSMIGLILAFMVAPLALPCMLFAVTKPYFDAWWKLILSLILQPVIIILFLSFTMGMFTEIVDGAGGLKEIYRTAFKPDMQVAASTTTGTQTQIESLFTMFGDSGSSSALGSVLSSFTSGGSPIGGLTSALTGQSGTVAFETKTVMSLISIFVISYLLNQFTQFVMDMSRELTGNAMSPSVVANIPSLGGGLK